MSILVTGGAGFIGSHTCVELLENGYDVVVVDNLSNSCEKSLERVKEITGKEVTFYKGDILDREFLEGVFEKEDIASCIHFAGLKAVGESVEKPWEYYHNNLTGTLILVDVLKKYGAKNLIFFIFCDCLWRSGTDPDHRRMSKGSVHESIRLDKIHVRAGFDRYSKSRSGLEYCTTSIL